MMSEPIIKIETLSKKYKIGERASYGNLREEIMQTITKPFKRLKFNDSRLTTNTDFPEIWALHDISFSVNEGEVVGIIGRNGAGKSTLLKILSRITEPTSGRIILRGRVASLLEVGTGFHPELTGRENIFLNGALLGMSRQEINRKFDEIVAFAEIERFLDTPVKRYSSGMYVRLAFAVAAHLEPEILIVDEVLAVGDAAFQKKCLGKMGDVAKEGRTVVLVSHSVPTIVSLCTRCVLLDEGRLILDGKASEVTALYQERLATMPQYDPEVTHALRQRTGKGKFISVTIRPLGPGGRQQSVLRVGDDMEVDLTILALEKIMHANVGVVISETSGYRVIDAALAIKGEHLNLNPGQQARIRFTFHNILLRPDTYRLGLWMGRRDVEDIEIIPSAKLFAVEVNPERTSYFQTFPAVYQCEFTHTVGVHEPDGGPGITAGIIDGDEKDKG